MSVGVALSAVIERSVALSEAEVSKYSRNDIHNSYFCVFPTGKKTKQSIFSIDMNALSGKKHIFNP
ncbi:hypothetical protein FACS189434_04190 [Bacteroidia bacterium]|nr:hypothetical protein FACS189434_04190 [Bacteroidia bacterium]